MLFPIESRGPSALFSKQKQHPQDRFQVFSSAICSHQGHCGTPTSGLLDPAESWPQKAARGLSVQPGDIWGRGSSCPPVHKLTWPHRQDQAPGGRKAHLGQKTEHIPPTQETSPGWAWSSPGSWRKPCQAEQWDRASRSASHALEASVVRWTVISQVKAHTVRARSPRR